jgi:hypothetical protein
LSRLKNLGNRGLKLFGEGREIDAAELGELDHGLEPIDVVAFELDGGLLEFEFFGGLEEANVVPFAQIFEAIGVDRARPLNDLDQAGFVKSGVGLLGHLLEVVEGGGLLVGGELLDQGDRFFGGGEGHKGREGAIGTTV